MSDMSGNGTDEGGRVYDERLLSTTQATREQIDEVSRSVIMSSLNTDKRIAELERMLEHQRIMLKHQGVKLVCYENDVDALVELICDMWKCLSAHIESAINDGGCGYPYSPQTRGCGEGCTVNGEDCSMSLIERRMRRLGIEVQDG